MFAGHEVFLSIQESLTPKLLHPSPTTTGHGHAATPTAASRSMEPARRPEHSTGAVVKSPSRSLLLRDLSSVSGDHDTPLMHDGTSPAQLADIGRQRYCQAMNGAFALMTVVNCAMATSGYLAFGALAESNVLVNLGVLRDRYDGTRAWLSARCSWLSVHVSCGGEQLPGATCCSASSRRHHSDLHCTSVRVLCVCVWR